MRPPTPITTDTPYDLWYVTTEQRISPGKAKTTQYLCRCKCGTERWVNAGDLYHHRSTNCGCVRRAKVAARNLTHGKTHTREYVVWCGIIARCENPKHKSYHRYGGRGITICERWRHSFEAFLADMGSPPFPGAMIDRERNGEGYGPDNCRWVSNKQNVRNSSQVVSLTHRGITKLLVEWAEELNIPAKTISARLHRSKWSVDRALSTPVMTLAQVGALSKGRRR